MRNLLYKLRIFFKVILQADHFILIEINDAEYRKQAKGQNYKVKWLYYQMNDYKRNVVIKGISEKIDDIDMLLTRIENSPLDDVSFDD